jgi:Ca2+-binding RTX toxin-like protein
MSVKTVAFVDSRVGHIDSLIASNSEEIVWFTLNEEEDGLDQMQRILRDFSELDSIQIISHGSIGTLYLGSIVLNSSNLSNYQAQLQAIGASFATTGDILLYGCDVAQGEVGLSFINSLAEITGADVAASSDLTGAQGNWVLEAEVGVIESVPLAVGAYTGTLDIVNGTDGNDSMYGTLGNDVLNGGAGTDTVIYTGNQSSYVIAPILTGGMQVSCPEGVDILLSIKRLTFADASIQIIRANPSAEFQVNTYYNGQGSPSVTAFSDGGRVVTWKSDQQDSSGYGMYSKLYSSAGEASGSELHVNTFTSLTPFLC